MKMVIDGGYNLKIVPCDNKSWREIKNLKVNASIEIDGRILTFRGNLSLQKIKKA